MRKSAKKQTRRTSTTAAPGAPLTSRGADREFAPDYSYVMKDLKRIGLLAGSFFVVLIVLSFILK